MDIVKRNLMRLLTSGALNEYEPLEPMSRYKWQRLFALAVTLHVDDLVEQGARHHQYAPDGLPAEVLSLFLARSQRIEAPSPSEAASSYLCNAWLNRRLEAIRRQEPHQIDASMDTLQLLNLLVAATRAMFERGIVFRETLLVGRYLRTKGQHVDFVKLDAWLRRLRLSSMANLTGNMLIAVFGFESDEIPFVGSTDQRARRMVMNALQGKDTDALQGDWHFRQQESGLVTGNTRVWMTYLSRCMKFVPYAPLEAFSTLIKGFLTSLSEIEE